MEVNAIATLQNVVHENEIHMLEELVATNWLQTAQIFALLGTTT